MPAPSVTIVVVPRERFGEAVSSLHSVYRFTTCPFHLVYVDGRSPPPVRRSLDAAARAYGFRLTRTRGYLSPNEARNRGLALVDTPYVAFVDNDVTVAPHWLERLVACAEQTGAWLAAPLYYQGLPGAERIHMAGGEVHIEERGGGRYLRERHHLSAAPLAAGTGLRRGPTELVEFHCLLAKTEALRQLGGLDESLLNAPEHVDLCLSVRAAGGAMYLEPSATIRYTGAAALQWSDLPYFLLRWSDAWTSASLDHFQRKWRLAADDPYLRDLGLWMTNYRRDMTHRWRGPLRRLAGARMGAALGTRLERAAGAWAHQSRRRRELATR